MRFLLKSAFWLGLVAFLLPFGGGSKETAANITFFGTIAGAQQALQDFTGFCGRAPEACATGREFAIFAGERIGDGIQMAYGLVEDRVVRPEEVLAPGASAGTAPDSAQAAAAVSGDPAFTPTDPVMTGTLGPSDGARRRPASYRAPKRPAGADETTPDTDSFSREPAVRALRATAAVPTPTPAPRA